MKQVREALGNKWVEVSTFIGKFGAETPQPTQLYSGSGYVRHLSATMKREEMEKLKHHADDIVEHDTITGQVNGIGDKLKTTQAYPKAYGVAVAKAFSDDQALCEVSSDSDSSKDEGEMAHPDDL